MRDENAPLFEVLLVILVLGLCWAFFQHEEKPPPAPPPRVYVQHYPAIGETLVQVGGSRWRMMWVGRDSIFHSCVMDPDSLLKLVRPF